MNLILVFSVVFISFEQIVCVKHYESRNQQKNPEILFCNSNREIRIVSLNDSMLTANPTIYRRHMDRSLSRTGRSKTRRTTGAGGATPSLGCNNDIDYDITDNYLVWSNSTSIIVAPLDKKNRNVLNIPSKQVLLKTDDVQRVSLDWIHDLLYYIENGAIRVISIRNEKIKTITDVQQPNSNYFNAIDVVVNPIDSFIVWIRWDRRTFDFKLMKADQSGDNQKILVDLGFYGYDSRSLNPCCLTIDYESKRIYFVDNKLQTLESVLFDGTKRSSHLHSPLFAQTNSLDIYGDLVFWSNKGQNTILSTNKLGSSATIRTILKSEHNIDSLRVLHNTRQPQIDNRCEAKCPNLCIPATDNQYLCACDRNDIKKHKYDCNESHYVVTNMTLHKDKKVDEIITEPQINEIVITENYAKSYPLYVFKCQTNDDENSAEDPLKTDWYTSDGRKLIDKLKKSPIAKNITRTGNSIELKVSYPYIKQLDKFKCRATNGNQTTETFYRVIVRQLPPNPKIMGHSLSFAGVAKVYLTLQIENVRVEPPIDKYRIVYRGIFNFYQQEYWLDFNALSVNETDRNTLYIVKLDVDYTTQDLMAFKLYAHNEVGWSYPLFN